MIITIVYLQLWYPIESNIEDSISYCTSKGEEHALQAKTRHTATFEVQDHL